MKVLDLACSHGHGFEAWIASEDEFQSQLQRGLLTCPVCGCAHVVRRPSAPRLNLAAGRSGSDEDRPDRPERVPAAEPDVQALREAWSAVLSTALRGVENVGERFPEEVRRMHYGEAEPRRIRGRATADQRDALLDEGIEVLPLPDLPGLDGPLQ